MHRQSSPAAGATQSRKPGTLWETGLQTHWGQQHGNSLPPPPPWLIQRKKQIQFQLRRTFASREGCCATKFLRRLLFRLLGICSWKRILLRTLCVLLSELKKFNIVSTTYFRLKRGGGLFGFRIRCHAKFCIQACFILIFTYMRLCKEFKHLENARGRRRLDFANVYSCFMVLSKENRI